MDFSKNLIIYRKMRKLTQVELAKKVGVGQYTISCWEHGHLEPNLTKLAKVAKVLDVSVDVLLGTRKLTRTDQEVEVDSLVRNYISNVYFVSLTNEFEKCPPEDRDRLIRIMRAIIKEFPERKTDKEDVEE